MVEIKLNFQIFIRDLPRDKLTARSALWADHTIRVAEMAFWQILSYHDVVSEYPSMKIKKSSGLVVYLKPNRNNNYK